MLMRMLGLCAAALISMSVADRAVAISLVLSTTATETLNGTTFNNQTAMNFDTNPPPDGTASVYFDGSVIGAGANIDALTVLANGDFVFSTQFDSSISWDSGNQTLNFLDGDLIQVSALDGSASILLSESVITGSGVDIDGVHIRDNGNIIISTVLSATIGTLAFTDGDLVEFDPNDLSTASILFDDTLYTSVGSNNTNSVSILPNGDLIMTAAATVTLDGNTFDAGDVFSWNGVTSALVLDGAGPFQLTSPGQVDALYVTPEPSTGLLLALGFVGMACRRHRERG